ncbi:MAG: HpcH/HpaI aldolase/citrate lyase family protein [Thermomicrobiales bacterium]
MTAITRIARSVLSIPANNPRMIEKGLASSTDMVFLDLEDATAPNQKTEARASAIDALRNADWRDKPRMVRINAVGTPWFIRDLVDLVEQAGDRIDLVLVPKIDFLADIHTVDRMLLSLEASKSLAPSIHIEAQIESAAALTHCDAIASSSSRLESLVYGPGDLAASLRLPGRAIGMRGVWDDRYHADRLHYPLMRILIAARTNGLRAIDGPFADFRDPDGLRHAAEQTRALGFDGKWCIHPGQIDIVNEVFTPDDDEIADAREIVAAYAEATSSGSGAVVHQGIMIDAASVRLAKATLAIADRVRR